MVEQQSSFIPKAPTKAKSDGPRSRKIYILTYVSFAVFFGALLASGIAFVWGMQAQGELNVQQNRLDQEFMAFDEAGLAEITELDRRMQAAALLLDENVSAVSILSALELTTVSSVEVISVVLNKELNNTYLLEVKATAPEFNSVRYQRELLSANPVLVGSSVVETTYGIILDEEGDQEEAVGESGLVSFTLSKVLTADDIPSEPNVPSQTSLAPLPASFEAVQEEVLDTVDLTGTEVIADGLDDALEIADDVNAEVTNE